MVVSLSLSICLSLALLYFLNHTSLAHLCYVAVNVNHRSLGFQLPRSSMLLPKSGETEGSLRAGSRNCPQWHTYQLQEKMQVVVSFAMEIEEMGAVLRTGEESRP